MKFNLYSFLGMIQTAYKISLKPALAKYSASLRVETVIGPSWLSSAILAISMLFGADDRTLEDREVAEELEKILSDIGKKIPLEIRD